MIQQHNTKWKGKAKREKNGRSCSNWAYGMIIPTLKSLLWILYRQLFYNVYNDFIFLQFFITFFLNVTFFVALMAPSTGHDFSKNKPKMGMGPSKPPWSSESFYSLSCSNQGSICDLPCPIENTWSLRWRIIMTNPCFPQVNSWRDLHYITIYNLCMILRVKV